MNVACIVQARMGSVRFPGKVLADLGGRPLLQFMLERLSGLPLDHLIVATGRSGRDDSVAAAASACGAKVVRGPEGDVLERFNTALKIYPAEVTIRLTADCPLSDPEIIHAGLQLMEKKGADYVSNTLVRTFPDGLDVEIIRSESLIQSATEATDIEEREHVTPFIYRRPDRFRLCNLRNSEPLGGERWTVDTPSDLEFLRRLLAKSDRLGSLGYREIFSLTGSTLIGPPGIPRLRPAMPSDEYRLLKWRNEPAAYAQSLSRRPVAEEEHHRWFARILENPASRIWIAEVNLNAVGQVRVDVEQGKGAVSLIVAPEFRGRGYGRLMLTLLNQALSADHQIKTLVGDIRSDNEASLRTFLKAGYGVESSSPEITRVRLDR